METEQAFRTSILGIRLTPEERQKLNATAEQVGLSPSEFARSKILGHRSSKPKRSAKEEPQPRKRPVSWMAELLAIGEMAPGEGMVRFKVLVAGRRLPDGFSTWTLERRAAWLQENWPL